MQMKQNFVSKEKYSIKCPYSMKAEYITIHNTANDASAEAEIAYMIRNDKQVSYHFAVDDKLVVQGLPINRNGWHAGDGGNGKGNRKSIGIEICYSKSGGEKHEKAYANSLELVALLMKKYEIPAANIMYHKNWSGKNCPHRLLENGITVEKYRKAAQAKYNELYGKKTTATATKTTTTASSFLPKRGYFKKGDKSANVGKIASFMRKVFPSYTSEKALGNTYGTYLIAAVTEFQKRTGLEPDGYFGPKTLAKLKQFGFKE